MSKLAFFIFIAFLSTSNAVAAPRSPYRAKLALRGFEELLAGQETTLRRNTPSRETIAPALIAAQLPRLGRLRGKLNRRWNRNWKAEIYQNGRLTPDPLVPLLLGGDMRLGGNASDIQPLSASIIGGRLRIAFVSHSRQRAKRQRFFELRAALQPGNTRALQVRIRSFPVSALPAFTCGTNESHRHSLDFSGVASAATAYQFFDIKTDTDAEWYAIYGAESNAQVAALLNDVMNLIYKPQLGLGIDIESQTANNPNYTSTASEILIGQAADNMYYGSQPDLKHAFFGRDFDGSTIGIAYGGVACLTNYQNIGISQHSYTYGFLVTTAAHEIAHNFNATHDTSSPGTIMYPSGTGEYLSTFSQFSKDEISVFLAYYGSCLETRTDTVPDDPGPDPEPTPTATPDDSGPVPVPTSSPDDSGGSGSADPDPPTGITSENSVLSLNAVQVKKKIQLEGRLETSSEIAAAANLQIDLYLNKFYNTSVRTDETGAFRAVIKRRAFKRQPGELQARLTGTKVSSELIQFTPKRRIKKKPN